MVCEMIEESTEWVLWMCAPFVFFVLWFIGAVLTGRGIGDVCKGLPKTCSSLVRTRFGLLKIFKYVAKDDDLAFFSDIIPQVPKPETSTTNFYLYLCWRRRSLYALLPVQFLLLVNAMAKVPDAAAKVNHDTCHQEDSMIQCGGPKALYAFLTASGSGEGIFAYELVTLAVSVAIAVYQLVAVRMAVVRSNDWAASRKWLMWSWAFPFLCAFLLFVVPLESVFSVDYEERGDKSQMLPFLSTDVNSQRFDMCTAWGMCETTIDAKELTTDSIAVLLEKTKEGMVEALEDAGEDPVQYVSLLNLVDPDKEDVKAAIQTQFSVKVAGGYPTQDTGTDVRLKVGTTGGIRVAEAIDTLDYLMSNFVSVEAGKISAIAEGMIKSFAKALQAAVKTKASFLSLKTVAPAAMALLPGLQKGALAAKLTMPQDVFAGWIVRGVPCLYGPLVGVFIILLGQMASDWFVMGACICLIIAQLSVAIFASGIATAVDDKMVTEPLESLKRAKHMALLFNLIAVVLAVVSILTNVDLEELEFPGKEPLKLLELFFIFFLKFIVGKLQSTIIFADLVIELLFSVHEALDNESVQRSFRDEMRLVRDDLRKPPVSGSLKDFFAGDSAKPIIRQVASESTSADKPAPASATPSM